MIDRLPLQHQVQPIACQGADPSWRQPLPAPTRRDEPPPLRPTAASLQSRQSLAEQNLEPNLQESLMPAGGRRRARSTRRRGPCGGGLRSGIAIQGGLVLLALLLPPGARAAGGRAAALPPWLLWGAAGLALLLLVLASWQRDRLAEARDWLVVNVGGLLAPLRPRRHVIHDPGYLRDIIRAELESDPQHWNDEPDGVAPHPGGQSPTRNRRRQPRD